MITRPLLALLAACCATVAAADPVPLEVYTVTAAKTDESARVPVPYPHYVMYAKSEQVSYADLDLSQPADVAVMRERLSAAAHEACKSIGRKHANASPKIEACAQEAMGRALASLHRRVDASVANRLAQVD